MELRKRYGNNHVVAGFRSTQPSEELANSGPLERVDATNLERLNEVVKKYKIDTIYNLAALLSAVAEEKPQSAWDVGVNGVFNVLEIAREHGCAVFSQVQSGRLAHLLQWITPHRILYNARQQCTVLLK